MRTPRHRSAKLIHAVLTRASETGEVVTVSNDGAKDDVLVYGVGEDYYEFSVIEEDGGIVSGVFIVPLRYVNWAQIGSRRQEIIELILNRS